MSSLSFHDIGLKPSLLRAVEKKARNEGKSPPEYLRSLIERDLLASKSFDEILKPIREGFTKAGVTEGELDSLVTRAQGHSFSQETKGAAVTIERPRVVFDCNVLLQAAANENGPAAEALRLLETSRIDLFVSRATLRELRSVFDYPTIRAKNANLTDLYIAAFIERLTFKATLVRRVRHVFNYPRAKQDEQYVDLAVAVKADFLVSRDNDLLSLTTGHSAVCKQFRHLTHPLKVLDPVEFLKVLGARSERKKR